MVQFGMVMKAVWLALLILLNVVHFGEGLAADRNLRWSADEPAATDVRSASKEAIEASPLQNASHLLGSVSMHGRSRQEELEMVASDKSLELSVANQSLSSTVNSHGGANISVLKSSVNRTSTNPNISLSEHALSGNTGNSTADSRDGSNSSQAQSIVQTTLCTNGSLDKETMRVEVEFASTVLENGLYDFIMSFNKLIMIRHLAIDMANCINKM